MLFDAMTPEMVKAMIEVLPLELTVIDSNDEVAGWNKHESRLFKRPLSSMGVNFRDCHPKTSLEMVERIVSEMKEGKREKASFWIDMAVTPGGPKHKIMIDFFALRDERGKYLGCLECTQDAQAARSLEGQKRPLD